MLYAQSGNPVLFPRISAAHVEGSAQSIRHRQRECHQLQHALVKDKSLLIGALRDDNGYSETEALFEFGLTLWELRQVYETINMDAYNSSNRAIEEGRREAHHISGAGVVYIIPARSKSSLFNVLSPLAAATAAGTCVIVEVGRSNEESSCWLLTKTPDGEYNKEAKLYSPGNSAERLEQRHFCRLRRNPSSVVPAVLPGS